MDLLFLIDSITQHAFQLSLKDKGRPEREFIGAVRDSLGQLLAAVLPPNKAEAEPDNYHQCLKVRAAHLSNEVRPQRITQVNTEEEEAGQMTTQHAACVCSDHERRPST